MQTNKMLAYALRGHIRTFRLAGLNDGMVEDLERAAKALDNEMVFVGYTAVGDRDSPIPSPIYVSNLRISNEAQANWWKDCKLHVVQLYAQEWEPTKEQA